MGVKIMRLAIDTGRMDLAAHALVYVAVSRKSNLKKPAPGLNRGQKLRSGDTGKTPDGKDKNQISKIKNANQK